MRRAARTCMASSSCRFERDERGQGDAAARAPVEARPRPDLAPGVARDQVLELRGERVAPATAASTCSSPSTSRRTRIPRSCGEPVTRLRAPSCRAPARGRRRAGRAEIGGRIQRGIDFVGREVLGEHLAQRPAAGEQLSSPARGRSARRAPGPPPPTASRRRGLRRMRSASTSQPGERRPRPGRGSARGGERGRQRRPLRMPGARLRARARLRPMRSGRPPAPRPAGSTRARARPRTGLRLCGIVDEPPASAVAHLGDLGLGEQRHVERDLGARAAPRSPAPRRARRSGPRTACQGTTGSGEPELGGEERQHLGAVAPERRQRARGPSELGRQSLVPDLDEPPPRLDHADEPAGGLQPEGRRHRLLEQRARRPSTVSRCASASSAHAPATASRSPTIARARGGRRARPRCRATSWLVAPLWTWSAASPPTASRSARTSGSTGLPALRPATPSCFGVEARRLARGGDRLGRGGRDHARARLGERERALGVEHRREPGAPRDGLAHRVRHEERREQLVRAAKKTVSRSPCSRTSKRSSPSPAGSATSVARRSSSRPDSTGSAAFASARPGSRRASGRAGAARARTPSPRGAAPLRRGAGFATTNAKRPSPSVPLATEADRRDARARRARRCTGCALAVEHAAGEPDRARRVRRRPARGRSRQPEREVRADRLRRRRRAPLSPPAASRRAAEHDVEPVRERPLRLGRLESNRATSRSRRPGRAPTGRSGRTRTAGRRGSTSASRAGA